MLTEKELLAADNGEIFIGMSAMALLCSWGPATKLNTSTGSWGTHRQWVYRPYLNGSASYVYTENGKVTSFQQ